MREKAIGNITLYNHIRNEQGKLNLKNTKAEFCTNNYFHFYQKGKSKPSTSALIEYTSYLAHNFSKAIRSNSNKYSLIFFPLHCSGR